MPTAEANHVPLTIEQQVGHAAVRAQVETDNVTRALLAASRSSADTYARAVWNSRKQ